MTRSTSLVALAVAMLLASAQPVRAEAPPAPDVTAARSWLASQYGGTATRYTLLDEARYELDGVRLWAAKFFDARANAVRSVYGDGRGRIGGQEVREQLSEASAVAASALARKASRELLDKAAKARGSEKLPVAAWMDVDTDAAVARVIAANPEGNWIGTRSNAPTLKEQRRLRGLVERAQARAYAQAARELRRIAEDAGGSVGYVSTLAPLVYLDVPAAGLDALAKSDRVTRLGLEGVGTWEESLASAGPAVNANWTSGTSDQGAGVRVGVIEYYNVRATGDLYRKVAASWSASGTRTYTPSTSFDHPTWVAGAIASQDSVDRGIAPQALIVSAGTASSSAGLTRDRNVIRAADWAALATGGDADIINMSVNMDATTGRDEARAYFDALGGGAATRLVVASSGNYGSGVDAGWWVSSPGTGWNVLTVGGYNDGTGKLWYDSSCPCSGAQWEEHLGVSYNPHGDFQKPTVSAPATRVRTANGLSATGTSVATPITAAIAAQVLSRRPTLATWPETLRAIVVAGAVENHVNPMTGRVSVEHEGSGSVNARWANRVAVEGGGTYGGFIKGEISADTTVTKTFSVTGGQRVRVALAWNSRVSGSMFDAVDRLAADLDLIVTYPGGKKVSASWDNAVEWVEFRAPSSGTAKITIAKERIGPDAEPFGIAWAKGW
ncbi:MAG TPA: S8 family serine peptidase [Candidatus Limnocylindrales bacterium]|nr:S8 family serine peptidase [Candidatus Limnocylindrales bacterium]